MGHMKSTENTEIASTIINGLSLLGSTSFIAFFLAMGPAINVSSIKAATPIIGSSESAATKMKFFIAPVSSAML